MMNTEPLALPVLRAPRASALTAPWALPGRSTRLLFRDASGDIFHSSPQGWESTPLPLPADGRLLAAAAGREHLLALLEDSPRSSTLAFQPLPDGPWARWRLPFACRPSAALAAAGEAVVVDASGRVVLLGLDARSATPVSPAGFARQVHGGSDGSLWAVLEMERPDGFAVAVRRPGVDGWFTLPAPAAAVKVVGLSDGTAYGLNPAGEVWRFHPEGVGSFAECSEDPTCRNCLFSERRAGCRDLALGPDEVVWTVSADGRAAVMDAMQRVSFQAPIPGVEAVFGSYAA